MSKGHLFLLSQATMIDCSDAFGSATRYAAKALRRDIDKVIYDTDSNQPVNRIKLICDSTVCQEDYVIRVASAEELLVMASDDLGWAYGLYHISSRYLGVLPFWFWNDQKLVQKKPVELPFQDYSGPEYRVRYRGWFVNDEVLIDGWKFGESEKDKWELIFEALLRCGGNMVIPGTDKNSRINRHLAWDMGLTVTHHHAEPLGAEMFVRAYPDKEPSYTKNRRLFEAVWEKAIIEQKEHKVIWNVGFRGQGDRPFWEDDSSCISFKERSELISSAIGKQMALLHKHIPDAVCCTNLYGEVMEMYQAGLLKLPESVIKIWADNGYGNMVSRRQGNVNPRIPSLPQPNEKGPHGIYYHCSFHDLQASNHLTMSPTPPSFLAKNIESAIDAGADEYIIVNCGCVKPHTYTLDLMRALWVKNTDHQLHREAYMHKYYPVMAPQLERFYNRYANITGKYGVHEDDRAGEQLWHHPVRELLCAWISGNTTETVESLIWLAGDTGFRNQMTNLKNIAEETKQNWVDLYDDANAFYKSLEEDSAEQFYQSFLVQVIIQMTGMLGTSSFCQSYEYFFAKDDLKAFISAGEALEHYQKGVKAMTAAQTGKWTEFYRNDCLTDVQLTCACMGYLMEFIRILGDGPSFDCWEKQHLLEGGDGKVALLSAVTRPLSSHELYQKIKNDKIYI